MKPILMKSLLGTAAVALAMGAQPAMAASLADTTENDVEDMRGKAFIGESFESRLAEEYRRFSLYEADQMVDWIDAEYFAQKAKRTASGDAVMPENPQDWGIESERRMAELVAARAVLVELIETGVAETAPELTADAVARYDCWVEQQEEGWQIDQIVACRTAFLNAAAKLGAALEPDHPELAALLFFEFDEHELTAAAEKRLDTLAAELRDEAPEEILIVGHADRAGPEGYNRALSSKRAKTVANELIDRGVTGVTIDYDIIAKGETDPVIDTGDGEREAVNRRVSIYASEPEVGLVVIR